VVDPKFERKLRDLEERLLGQPGALDLAVRRAATAGDGVPEALAEYVQKVRVNAYLVTDQDVDELRRSGYSEDQIFELTVAAAYGAARDRLDTALEAMASRTPASPAAGERDA
jgi:alkylhydroperoxidase family enzyme